MMTVAVATWPLLSAATALAQQVDTARIEAGGANDWLTYHGSYKGWATAASLKSMPSNVKDLQVAWTHIPGHSTRGLQSMPLAADGVLYYTGSYSRTFALDGATGKLIWSFLAGTGRRARCRARRTRPTPAASRSAKARRLSAASTGVCLGSTPRPARCCGRPS